MGKDVKILDCTLRDGGLVNSFHFSDDFVKALYKTNIRSGIDYMEFGYKASSSFFSKEEYGKGKFCDESYIRSVIDKFSETMKITVMADIGRTNFKSDIIEKSDSIIDMIRIAVYAENISEALPMIDYCKKRGYEVAINIMAISLIPKDSITKILELLGKSSCDVVYLVDSYGALYPRQFLEVFHVFLDKTDKYGQKVGIHVHNNQQLAFANSIIGYENGADFIDISIDGLGRGAGNCASELFISYMNSNCYKITPLLEFKQKYMSRLKEDGMAWGYDTPYLITGSKNRHPISAIEFIKNKEEDYIKLYDHLK